MDYANTDLDPFYDSDREPDEAEFLRQEPVSRDAMAVIGWLFGLSLACLGALVFMACRQ